MKIFDYVCVATCTSLLYKMSWHLMCHTWTDVSCCCFLWLHFLWMYLSTEVWWAIAIIVINIAYICYDYLFSWCHFVH